jgi:hypothetical protein
VVAGHQDDLNVGLDEADDPPAKLALVGGGWVARLVDVAGHHHGVDALLDGAVDGLVQGVEEVMETGIQAGLGVEAAVVLHADVDVGEVGELDQGAFSVILAEELLVGAQWFDARRDRVVAPGAVRGRDR